MPAYFLSDVHLRRDRPERSRRLARWAERLTSGDSVTVVGDLCDFWFASRELSRDPTPCPGLRALAAFRESGGTLILMVGNHDVWLGPYYRDVLGTDLIPDSLDVTVHGLRVHVVHGHTLGARRPWKAAMEGRAFLKGFRALPTVLARGLSSALDRANESSDHRSNARHLRAFRAHAARQDTADLTVFGHVHQAHDEPADRVVSRPRLIVLGGWHHRARWLRIDADGAMPEVEDDPRGVV